jgi:hypothetical protein
VKSSGDEKIAIVRVAYGVPGRSLYLRCLTFDGTEVRDLVHSILKHDRLDGIRDFICGGDQVVVFLDLIFPVENEGMG